MIDFEGKSMKSQNNIRNLVPMTNAEIKGRLAS